MTHILMNMISNPVPHVLLVDDDDQLRNIIGLNLKMRGFLVLAAASGDDALALYQAHGNNISIVVTDTNMPGMSGVDLVRVLRERGYRGIVVATSGNFTVKDLRAYTDLGVNGLLNKPYEPSLLTQMLRGQ